MVLDTTQNKRRDNQVSFFVTGKEYEEIQRLAAAEGRSIANYVRWNYYRNLIKEAPAQ